MGTWSRTKLKVGKQLRGGGYFNPRPSDSDTLSGLLSRSGFSKAVRHLIDSHPDEAYLLIYGDIDRFKVYNDLYGTKAGDELLAAIGTMMSTIAPEGVVSCRLRADHFVSCYPRSAFDPDRILATLDNWFASYRADFTFFVRLGIYPIDDPSLDVGIMCDRALLALRAAKSDATGSKYVLYDERLRDTLVREQELAGEMAPALEQGQFVPYFQPQYRYGTGAIIGAEVLARWNHPTKGLIGPAEFIPVFERNGLVAALDYHIWDLACRCLHAWIDERGAENVPRLSVNLSRIDIYQDDLCTYLSGLIERYDIPLGKLHLEITESAYLEAPEQLIATLTKLRSAGFTIEMDDFGSGYSSLNTLKDVPVDVLKLDMGFLDAHDTVEGTRGGLILASIVRMARWLDLPTVAEGVETPAQAAYLASIGCEYMQGFLFSHPLDVDAYERLLNEASFDEVKHAYTEKLEQDSMDFWNAESQLALIFNSYVGAAAIVEYDGTLFEIVRANRAFAKTLGFIDDADDSDFACVHRDFLSRLNEGDRKAFLAAINAAIESGRETESEFRFQSGDGSAHWVHVRFRMLSRSGKSCSLYLLAEETTEKQALRDRLVATTDSIPGGLSFYEIGHGVRLLDFSDAAAQLTGCTREQYRDWCEGDALSVVLEDDRWIVESAIEEVRRGAQRAFCTARAKKYGGGFFWAHVSTSVVYRSDDVMYIVAVVIDVTKEKENEQRLKDQNAIQQQLYDAIPCGIVRYTAEIEAPQIISVNKAGCKILGVASFADYLAQTDGLALVPIHPDDRKLQQEATQKLIAGSAPLSFTYRIVRPDGSIGWIDGMSALAVEADGQPIIQSSFTDVSDRMRRRHETDMQRYADVLCTVYEEIFEFDEANDTYHLLYSAHRPKSNRKVSLGEAMKRWMRHIPDAEDRAQLLAAIAQCRDAKNKEQIVCTYRLEHDEKILWCQSTFLRVTEESILCCNKDVTERLSAEDRKVVARIAGTMGMLPVGVGVYTLREGGLYPLYVNDRMSTMFGFTPEEYATRIEQGMPILASEDAAALMTSGDVDEVFEKGVDVELKTKRRDGSPLVVRVQGRAVHEEHGDDVLYAVATDITAEVRERRARAWQNERYRLLSEMTHSISFDYDSEADTVLLYIDRTGEGMEAQVIPHYLETLSDTRNDVVHPDSIDAVRQMFESVRAGANEVVIEYRADYYGTGYAWYRASLFVVHDEGDVWHLVGLIDNIEDERDLRFRAEYDATTGVSNHAATKDLITAALADPTMRERSVCVVLDIDDFKDVNDTCGHIEGDALLHAVGAALRSNFRESDIIGRVGGDEFVLLLKNIDLAVALKKLEHVRRQIAGAHVKGFEGKPSISVGVYATGVGDRTYRDVFVKADQALYQAKRAGKNRIHVCGA